MRKWIAVVGALALASSLTVAAAAQDASDDEAALKEMAGKWAEAWNKGDVAAIGAMYTEDADYIDIYGKAYKGRPAIEAAIKEINSSVFEGSKMNIESVATHPVKPDVVVGDSVWEVTGVPESEGPAPPSKGEATVVFVKTDGGWKIAAHRSRVPQSPVPSPEE